MVRAVNGTVNMPNPRSDWKPSEWELIVGQVKTNKEAFIRRLVKNLRTEGECQIWTGHCDRNGYARIDFRLPGARQPECKRQAR